MNIICPLCEGKGAISGIVSHDNELWHPDGIKCIRCDGLGLIETLSNGMKLIACKKESGGLMTVTFYDYDDDDWDNCQRLMKSQDKVTLVEYLTLEEISRMDNSDG